jgi:hypothetical protein
LYVGEHSENLGIIGLADQTTVPYMDENGCRPEHLRA